MAIDRYALVTKHNPKLSAVTIQSPLSVGNGDFVYTADVTGMQSLISDYLSAVPLCTMAHWGTHTLPADHPRYHQKKNKGQDAGVRQGSTPAILATTPDASSGNTAAQKQDSLQGRTAYTLKDLTPTTYPYLDRTVGYPVNCAPGEESVYTWLRENPHRANLALIGLSYRGQALTPAQLSDISQELSLYTGVIHSAYTIEGIPCEVETVCDSDTDTVAFRIRSNAFTEHLSAFLAFPFASPEKAAGSFSAEAEDQEETVLSQTSLSSDVSAPIHILTLRCRQNNDIYFVTIFVKNGVVEPDSRSHTCRIYAVRGNTLSLTVSFAKAAPPAPQDFETVLSRSTISKKNFWEHGAAIDFSRCKDPRAKELERRMILSEYLLSIQSAGALPPPETGLTCNSWYGKFHLEMHPWHAAWLPLWGHGDLLEKSLCWYQTHLPEARENARKNGFAGARWPKMVGEDGMDSPSVIAPLLIWQQPHLIFMCELLYQAESNEGKKKELLFRYFPLLKETADFMADFAVYVPEYDRYELFGPMIPAQECHRPEDVKNPTFEVEYWYYGLKTALHWAKRLDFCLSGTPATSDPRTGHVSGAAFSLDKAALRRWSDISEKLFVPTPDKNGLYPAHENCPDTFTRFNEDHPSMLCAYGLLDTGRLEKKVAAATLQKIEECWDYNSLWGWDFAVLAMTALRLGNTEHALSLLLSDTPKNRYVTNGHNNQEGDASLPLYLPGNGSLLLALAMFAGSFPGAEACAGFPKNGLWEDIQIEGFPERK